MEKEQICENAKGKTLDVKEITKRWTETIGLLRDLDLNYTDNERLSLLFERMAQEMLEKGYDDNPYNIKMVMFPIIYRLYRDYGVTNYKNETLINAWIKFAPSVYKVLMDDSTMIDKEARAVDLFCNVCGNLLSSIESVKN